jgi:hypothetical protein
MLTAEKSSDHLYQSASMFAQRAVADLGDDHIDACLANLGIALEHLMKAVLAAEHPLLLVGDKRGEIDVAGMVWALGKAHVADAAPGFTISATEAARRCSAIVPGLGAVGLRPVLDARNGVVHVGLARERDANRLVGVVAAAADLLLPRVEATTAQFWGNYCDAALGRLDENRTAAAHRAADKLAAARASWESTALRLGEAGVSYLKKLVDDHAFADDEEPVECPVCGTQAVASGDISITEEPEYGHDGPDWYVEGVSLIPHLHVRSVHCSACGLNLDDDEVAGAGFDMVMDSDAEVREREYWGSDDWR